MVVKKNLKIGQKHEHLSTSVRLRSPRLSSSAAGVKNMILKQFFGSPGPGNPKQANFSRNRETQQPAVYEMTINQAIAEMKTQVNYTPDNVKRDVKKALSNYKFLGKLTASELNEYITEYKAGYSLGKWTIERNS